MVPPWSHRQAGRRGSSAFQQGVLRVMAGRSRWPGSEAATVPGCEEAESGSVAGFEAAETRSIQNQGGRHSAREMGEFSLGVFVGQRKLEFVHFVLCVSGATGGF